MSQSLNLQIKGLYTAYNELSEAPKGALLVADNIDIDQLSVAMPRRGFDRIGGEVNVSAGLQLYNILSFQDTVLCTFGADEATNLARFDGSTWTSYSGSVVAPAGTRHKFAFSNNNLYFTYEHGVRKLDDVTGSIYRVGGPKGLSVRATTSASTDTWLAVDGTVAYRVVWKYVDANDNLILGAPSPRARYNNGTASAVAVDLTVPVPRTVDTTWYVQIYRSEIVADASDNLEPSDELGLVYEGQPSSTDITNGYMTITDVVKDGLRGATIYTAATQEGLANQNEPPPIARDIALYRDCLFYAHVTTEQRYVLTLAAIGGTDGLAAADTLTIDGRVYTAAAAEDVAAQEFEVFTGGTAEDVRKTAESLVWVINRDTNGPVNAFYLSGPNDGEGQILLERRQFTGSVNASITLVTSNPDAWIPNTIPTSGTSLTFPEETLTNGIFWSKPGQPEHVPLVNFALIGSANSTILRIISLEEALYIFKDDGKLYKLSGYYPNFQVDEFSSSLRLLAPETCAVLDNKIFALTNQGVAVIPDLPSGISKPIEQDLLDIIEATGGALATEAFAVADESARKYYLWLPADSDDTAATKAYVYNTVTGAWTRYTIGAKSGYIDQDRNFYLGIGKYLWQQNNNRSFLDYVDFGFTTTISTIDERVLTINSNFSSLEVGDIIYQSATLYATITEIDTINSTFTINSDPGLTAAAATVYKAIQAEIQWIPVDMGNPAVQKQFHTTTLMFKEDFRGTATLSFKTDLSQYDSDVALTSNASGSWGLFPWGEVSWGGEAVKRPLRQWVPRDKQRASQLTITFSHAWGYSPWKLLGVSVFASDGSERISR